ncbi:AAA family ATPase [Streptomyces sp. HC307]|uniref:AAA family ATPase n=1 Tax=Streptomyces flavusporus TaxID=3385496 RepID=UPI003916D813
MGGTAAKLRLVSDAVAQTRAVYLFDEFDALGAERAAGNDVGAARRILNSFVLFLDEAPSESLVVAGTHHHQLLEKARTPEKAEGPDRTCRSGPSSGRLPAGLVGLSPRSPDCTARGTDPGAPRRPPCA